MDSREKDLAREERVRASDRFEAIPSVHSATIDAFDVLSTIPDVSAAIGASIRMRLWNDPKYSADQLDDAAKHALDAVTKERDPGYATVRSSTLVAVCGAFEYLVKAAFVDKAISYPAEAGVLLTKVKIRLVPADVLGASTSETWFAIADLLFEQLAEPHPRMHERLKRYLLEPTYLHFPGKGATWRSNLAKWILRHSTRRPWCETAWSTKAGASVVSSLG